MNRRTLLFLLEEPSAQDLLQGLLPRLLMTGGVGKKDPRPELPQGAKQGADRSAGIEATPDIIDSETLELRYIVFQGKQDMEKRLVRRIRSWLHPNTFFVVLRDQDQGDCHQVKEKLSQLVRESGRREALTRWRLSAFGDKMTIVSVQLH